MRAFSGQRGFTLMEVMASTAASAVVIAAATAFLLKFLAWYDELSSRIAINRHARETYQILSLGGRSASTGNDGTVNVYGLRGHKQVPSSAMSSNYSLRYVGNNLTLTPDLITGMSVTCTGTAAPMPDCTSGGGTKTVTGWIGASISTNTASRSVSGKTVEVTFTIMNPNQILRAVSPSLFAENYHALFTFNRNEADP